MLLTTPTSLSFLGENCLRTNNSSSHIIPLFFYIHYALPFFLFLLITLSSPLPRSPCFLYLSASLSPLLPCPNFLSVHFISLQSMLHWFLRGLSCHISISLNSHTHSIALCLSLYLAGCFSFLLFLFNLYFFHYSQSPSKFNLSLYLWKTHCKSPPFIKCSRLLPLFWNRQPPLSEFGCGASKCKTKKCENEKKRLSRQFVEDNTLTEIGCSKG